MIYLYDIEKKGNTVHDEEENAPHLTQICVSYSEKRSLCTLYFAATWRDWERKVKNVLLPQKSSNTQNLQPPKIKPRKKARSAFKID